jgi:hypothetical protein
MKFALFYFGVIDFYVLANTAFAAFLAIHFDHVRIKQLKYVGSVFIALGLFYIDILRLPNEKFSADVEDVLSLVSHIFTLESCLIVFTLAVAFWYFSQWVRFTTVTVVGLCLIAIYGQSHITKNEVITHPTVEVRS